MPLHSVLSSGMHAFRTFPRAGILALTLRLRPVPCPRAPPRPRSVPLLPVPSCCPGLAGCAAPAAGGAWFKRPRLGICVEATETYGGSVSRSSSQRRIGKFLEWRIKKALQRHDRSTWMPVGGCWGLKGARAFLMCKQRSLRRGPGPAAHSSTCSTDSTIADADRPSDTCSIGSKSAAVRPAANRALSRYH